MFLKWSNWYIVLCLTDLEHIDDAVLQNNDGVKLQCLLDRLNETGARFGCVQNWLTLHTVSP